MNLNYLLQYNLFWVPFFIFGILALTGLVIGWRQGAKKALIFLGLNMAFGLIAILLFTSFFKEAFIGKVLKLLNVKIEIDNFDATAALIKLKYVIGVPLIAMALLLMNITLIPLIYLIIYLAFFKKSKSKNLSKTNYNIVGKFSGASIGLVTSSIIALPLALTAFNFTVKSKTLLNGKIYKPIYSTLNKIVKFASLNQIYDVHKIQDFQNALTLLTEKNSPFDVVKALFDKSESNNKASFDKALEKFSADEKSREKLTSVINDKELLKPALNALKIKKKFAIKSADDVNALLKNIRAKKDLKKLSIKSASKEVIKKFLENKALNFDGVNSKQKKSFLDQIVNSIIN